MIHQEINIKPYRNISSHKMINSLLKCKLVKVQKDELTRIYHLKRNIYSNERQYIVRLYQEILGTKSNSKPNTLDTNNEHTINCISDISFLN